MISRLILRRCEVLRDNTLFFLMVGILVLKKSVDLDALLTFGNIPSDEAVVCKLIEAFVAVEAANTIKRVEFNLLGVVFHAPFAVSHHPHHGKESRCSDGALE